MSDTAHPPRVFGCTACHDGQGEAVNSTAQAHGNVKFWEHPLHEGHDVEASCVTCHINVQGLEGADVAARGQQIFEQVGCTGCHLVEGYADIPKVGPSLRKLQAKLDPAWMVKWIENPREFRPFTPVCRISTSRGDEALAAAAYLWTASKKGIRRLAQGTCRAGGVSTGRRGHGRGGPGVGPLGGVSRVPRFRRG